MDKGLIYQSKENNNVDQANVLKPTYEKCLQTERGLGKLSDVRVNLHIKLHK